MRGACSTLATPNKFAASVYLVFFHLLSLRHPEHFGSTNGFNKQEQGAGWLF
jgi:hypothetical protein